MKKQKRVYRQELLLSENTKLELKRKYYQFILGFVGNGNELM